MDKKIEREHCKYLSYDAISLMLACLVLEGGGSSEKWQLCGGEETQAKAQICQIPQVPFQTLLT